MGLIKLAEKRDTFISIYARYILVQSCMIYLKISHDVNLQHFRQTIRTALGKSLLSCCNHEVA